MSLDLYRVELLGKDQSLLFSTSVQAQDPLEAMDMVRLDLTEDFRRNAAMARIKLIESNKER